MNKSAQVLLEMLAGDVSYYGRRLAQQLRSVFPRDVVVGMTSAQIRALEAKACEELEGVVWRFLCHFDNVGCHLPEGVRGYSIVLRLPDLSAAGPLDIRHEEMDYADMWLDFMLQRRDRERSAPPDSDTRQ